MVCPACSVRVPVRAFLSAAGSHGLPCDGCGIELEATYESRLRLMGGGLVLAYMAAGLARSFGLDGAFPLAASASAFGSWVYVQAGRIVNLRPARPVAISIR
jgi:hypothetical protein